MVLTRRSFLKRAGAVFLGATLAPHVVLETRARAQQARRLEEYFTPTALESQASQALAELRLAGKQALAGRLEKLIEGTRNPDQSNGVRFLVAHMASHQLEKNEKQLGEYVEKMYALRKMKLAWMPDENKIREHFWLQHVLMPTAFGEDPDLKGHLELQQQLLAYVKDKKKLQEDFPNLGTSGSSLFRRVFSQGITDLHSALVVADQIKNKMGVVHYTPTSPPRKRDLSIREMAAAAKEGIPMRGANFTMMDCAGARVLGIGVAPMHWGEGPVADIAPFTAVVDFSTGKHSLHAHFGEAGNVLGNALRTSSVEKVHQFNPARIPLHELGGNHVATTFGTPGEPVPKPIENITRQVVSEFDFDEQRFSDLRKVHLAQINVDAMDAEGKPVTGVVQAMVRVTIPDPNSPDKTIDTLLPAPRAALRGKTSFHLGMGNAEATSEEALGDELNRQVIQLLKQRGVNYALYLHAQAGGDRKTFLLEPTNEEYTKWRARLVEAPVNPGERLPEGMRLLNLFGKKHHASKISVQVQLPE